MNEGELIVAKQIYERQLQIIGVQHASVSGHLSLIKSQLKEVQRRLDELEVKE
jgi:hypothetical protein